MSTSLPTNEKELIRRMTLNNDKAEWGFELLLERRRSDLVRYFDALSEAGLFHPENNSGPIPSDKEGFVHIPFWPALKYLEELAKQVSKKDDVELSNKIMSIIRNVSLFRDLDGNLRDNYHTYHSFAKIIGVLPPISIAIDDIELISVWLSSKYDRGLVISALDEGYMRRALSSESAVELEKACRVLYHCTSIVWVIDYGFDKGKQKPISIVDNYWLEKFIEHHAKELGRKVGKEASDIFVDRLKEVFDPEKSMPSHWLRSTIEESDQNTPMEEPGDRFVEGLREVLSYWVEFSPKNARDYVREIIRDDGEIIRRIAIYTINQHWQELQDLFFSVISAELFSEAHLHELYDLLKAHFPSFADGEKARTLEAIRNIPLDEGEDKERWLKRTQQNWLSAIVNSGYEPADKWYRELGTYPKIGKITKHPNLHSYHESWSGPGPSPYTVQQLVKHAREGTLIDALHAFVEPDGFQGPETPTIRALVDVLSEAVKQYAEVFIGILPDFLHARRPFQYGVINGLMYLWNDMETNTEQQINWERAWEALLDYFTALLTDRNFWKEKVVVDQNMTPNRDWIPPLIASFLKAGTQSDKHAYPEQFLPKAWQLITVLLENIQPNDDIGDDPMFSAINSAKGKAIEALFNHALRVCRVSDKSKGQHANAWESMRPTFETELSLCRNRNFEMSTLSGYYIVNTDYLSHDWLIENIESIFPDEYQVNFVCAVDGMAYAPEHRPIYKLLVEKGVIDKALQLELKGRHSREKLIQYITLAYLWGDEEINGPRFRYLFDSISVGDLEVAGDFLWNIHNQQLRPDQIERIINFWSHCIEWSKTLDNPPVALLSSLGKLACYVKTIGESEKSLLMAVSPYVHIGHDADRFIEELERLADIYPKETCEILGRVLENYRPVFDYEDHLKSLIIKIAAQGGDEKQTALKYTDSLTKQKLKGMYELFKELQSS